MILPPTSVTIIQSPTSLLPFFDISRSPYISQTIDDAGVLVVNNSRIIAKVPKVAVG